MIFVKYDKTQIELLFAQSLILAVCIFVDTPRANDRFLYNDSKHGNH